MTESTLRVMYYRAVRAARWQRKAGHRETMARAFKALGKGMNSKSWPKIGADYFQALYTKVRVGSQSIG